MNEPVNQQVKHLLNEAVPFAARYRRVLLNILIINSARRSSLIHRVFRLLCVKERVNE